MESNSRADLGDKLRRTGTDALKAEVITCIAYEKFADIQNIFKNFGQRTKLTVSKTKQYMTTDKKRVRGGVGEHKKGKINFSSSAWTHRGTWTMDATY